MAITRVQTPITWATASTITADTTSAFLSDVMAVDQTTTQLTLQLKAQNIGTPASGDTCVVRILWSTDNGTTFDSAEYGQYLIALDTFGSNNPGENPAIRTIEVPALATSFKIQIICAQASTRNITFTARMDEQRVA